jgi:DNA modification methylase
MTTTRLDPPKLTIVRRKLSELTIDPANARIHDAKNLRAIRASLDRFGQVEPIVVQKSSGKVIGGNGRVAVLREMGAVETDVVEIDVTDAEAKTLGLALNRTAELAGWDEDVLGGLLRDLREVGLAESTGFSAVEIEKLLGPPAALAGEDDAPELPADPVSKPGDLWLLGPHRLLVGDATDGAAVARLMDGAMAAAMWTDPPYGVSYVGKTEKALTIENDGKEGLPALLAGAFAVATSALEPGAPVYIAHPAGPLSFEFERAVREARWRHHQTLVWVKDAMVLGHSDYHFRHEPILYGWTAGPGRPGRGAHEGSRWYGDDAQTTVIEIPRPKRNDAHPTMKPVELVVRCLSNSTKKGDLVYEPFAGSGTTLVACERLGRVCRAVEIDPRYADVVVERWTSLTGGTAQRRSA